MYSRWIHEPDYDPSAEPPTTECSCSESAYQDERIEIQSIHEIDDSMHVPSEKAEFETTLELKLPDEFGDDELVASNIIGGDITPFPGGSKDIDSEPNSDGFGAASGAAADDDSMAQNEQDQQGQKPILRSRRGRMILLSLALISLVLGAAGFAVTELPQMTFILLAAVLIFIFCIVSVSYMGQ